MSEKLIKAIRNITEYNMSIERIIVSTEDHQHYYSINPYKETVIKVADQYGKPIEGEVEIPQIPPLFDTN
ncbi:hypothetical protein KVQ86_08440 [Escherichia coli]|uniref:hypothetical protein n=1 Tax=Escherichia TaxID=561 RepID=UPI00141A5B83|nr:MULTISPECIES: hypothetical protein [Escherichia]KAF3715745.1 hypothetical protein FM737_002568 [Escherichia marmotae]MBV7606575.1 hypothetical protein [Escherichia coli]MBV7611552.1 hypothetical protein [Escherichia coli]MBV7616275.1 hypothetical protein [Escherichia coli]HAI5968190.1 hypothetical protein [Escherichia coli]